MRLKFTLSSVYIIVLNELVYFFLIMMGAYSFACRVSTMFRRKSLKLNMMLQHDFVGCIRCKQKYIVTHSFFIFFFLSVHN